MKAKLYRNGWRALALLALTLAGTAPALSDPAGRGAGRLFESLNLGASARAPGNAYARSDHDDARDAVREGRILPLNAVLGQVRRQVPGQLLDADLVQGRGRPVYRIKILTPNGSVALVTCDAVTGNVLGVRRGGR